MEADEVAAFLEQERTVVCATVGPRGWPHLMPLWYVLRERTGGRPGPQLWAWTYAASQKVRNLERDPRATLQVEAGEVYQELRGVMLECEVAIHRDLEIVKALGHELFTRYAAPRGEPRRSCRKRWDDRRPAGEQTGGAAVHRAERQRGITASSAGSIELVRPMQPLKGLTRQARWPAVH